MGNENKEGIEAVVTLDIIKKLLSTGVCYASKDIYVILGIEEEKSKKASEVAE